MTDSPPRRNDVSAVVGLVLILGFTVLWRWHTIGPIPFTSALEGTIVRSGETEPLDFLSPYGCSKGAADQYVLDFSRIYQIPATAFRQSCIYGTRQFGVEDQGWVAWFAIASLLGRDITIFGDGKQVRDVLHVNDLLHAYEAAILSPDKIAGQAFNVGGGPKQTLSLLELIKLLESRLGRKIPLRFDDWRPGDQEVYVSDIRKLADALEWKPAIGVAEGISQLTEWVERNRSSF